MRMRHLLRGLASWALILLILVGSPVLLLNLGSYPSDGWLTLLRPDDGTVLLIAVTTLGWLMWAWFAASIVAEAAAQLSGRKLRVPGLALPRSLAAGLVVSALAITIGSPNALADLTDTQATHSTPAPGSAVFAPLAPYQPPVTALPAPNRAEGALDSIREHAEKDGRATTQERSEDHTHVVEHGDDLWSLAEQYYGDGFAWRQIARANPDRLTGGPDVLETGWALTIPGVERGADNKPESVEVQPGDSLSALAEEHLGSASVWPDLYTANRAIIGDPDELSPGMVLELPAQAEKKSAPDSADAESPPTRQPGPDPKPSNTQPQTTEPSDTQPQDHADRTPAAKTDVARPRRSEAEPQPDSSPEAPTAQSQSIDSADGAGVNSDQLAGFAGVGALLAAGLMTGIAVRRRLQMAERPLGRRIIGNTEQLARLETAVGRRQDPLTSTTLAAAQQAIYEHCRTLDEAVPRLDRAEVSAAEVRFVFCEHPGFAPPIGFEPVTELNPPSRAGAPEPYWRLRRPLEPSQDSPSAYPGLVCLGSLQPGQHLFIDLATMPLLELDAPDPLLTGTSVALMMELACSWWASEVAVTLVGRPDEFVAAADLTSFGYVADPRRAIDGLLFRAAERRKALSTSTLAQSRAVSPEAWAPEIYLFCGEIAPDQLQRLGELNEGPECAMAAVVEGLSSGRQAHVLRVEEGGWPTGPQATLQRWDARNPAMGFEPQLIDEPLRVSIVELFNATDPHATEEATWWVGAKHLAGSSAAPEPHSNPFLVTAKPCLAEVPSTDAVTPGPESMQSRTPIIEGVGIPHALAIQPEPARPTVGAERVPVPQVRLLGPLELMHAAGRAPNRAQRQCIEYCAWLLAHPGASARQMADALFVAETTRRSNMSRLRNWLGEDSGGEPYLPDAYSGRIRLADGVDSDWLAFQRLVGAGIPRTGDSALVAALELVRGAPLADAAPGQWHWAEGLRTDIASAVRDAAVVLARRAVSADDVELARWATARGLAAAPQDELLLAARMEAEYRAGNQQEVDRLAGRITDQARDLDVSLREETVKLLQTVLEGRPRARQIIA